MKNIIECENLCKKYKETEALKNVSLTVPCDGGIVGLLGSNGSGKTTLIKILTGLLTPSSGTVRVDEKEIGVQTKAVVSYLSDAHSLNDGFTILQQLDYFCDFFNDFDRKKAEGMLADLGLKQKQKIKTLSKGMKEKLALALTLSRNAKLFILDEPIAGVDPAARDYILSTILSHKSREATMLISTHLISEIEHYFDYVIFLKQGEVVLSGKAEEIREREQKSIDALFREVFKWTVC